MDQRKRKRMISNRESARRSRTRKQEHLSDLTAQVDQLTNENHKIVTGVRLAMQQFITIEAENYVLKAQIGELSHRLESLNEIISFLNASNNSNSSNSSNNNSNFGSDDDHHLHHQGQFSSMITEYSAGESFMDTWN